MSIDTNLRPQSTFFGNGTTIYTASALQSAVTCRMYHLYVLRTYRYCRTLVSNADIKELYTNKIVDEKLRLHYANERIVRLTALANCPLYIDKE